MSSKGKNKLPTLLFAEGERVLCNYGPLIYEAKILKIMAAEKKKVKYFIHYIGFNKKWDEWVLKNRFLKYNKRNVQYQKRVSIQYAKDIAAKEKDNKAKKLDVCGASKVKKTANPSKSAGGLSVKPSPPSTVPTANQDDSPREKRPRIETSVASEEQVATNIKIPVKLPQQLQKYLADDFDAIVRLKKLFILPVKITVHDMLNSYTAFKKSSKISTVNEEVVNTLINLFDNKLRADLLYKFERPQYSDILRDHPDMPMSKIYGPFHFLRLLRKLKHAKPSDNLDNNIQVCFYDLLDYLVKNCAKFFCMPNLVTATPEYRRRVQ